MRRAIAPPARIKRALTLSCVKPTWGLMIVVAVRNAEVILELRTVDHLLPLKTAARCVSLGELWCCNCVTWRRMAATAHA